jgi:hypothetical protein
MDAACQRGKAGRRLVRSMPLWGIPDQRDAFSQSTMELSFRTARDEC